MNKEELRMLNSALWYAKEKGFSVIPIKPDKRPYLSWEKYQKEKADENQIRKWWGSEYRGANIGIVTGQISGLTVLDADSETGFAALVPFLDGIKTPSALTPKGRHIYFLYVDGVGNRGRFITDCDIRSEGGYVLAPPSVVNGKKYSWVEGASIRTTPFAAAPAALANLLKNKSAFSLTVASPLNNTSSSNSNNIINSSSLYRDVVTSVVTPDNKRQQTTTSDNISLNEGTRDNALFHLANHLVRGGMPIVDIRFYLEFFARRCSPPFPEDEIETKIQSAMTRDNAKNGNLTQEIRDFVLTTSGYITTTFVYNRQQVTTREEKKKVAIILHRLEKEGLIEATGRIAGEYRRVEKQFEAVDLMQISDGEIFDFMLPFRVDEYIDIFPRDLIVFAGVPNSGKTAVMLETLRINMNIHKCFYFSSEMGKFNCKKRLSKHDETKQWKFTFIEDFKNFVDVIQPDDVNFIDYLEVPAGEYYKIPSLLAEIHRKLNKGIAVVALQKQPDPKGGRTGWAVGGAQTLAKPAVFITIDPDYPGGVMRIVKAKNFKGENPNGYMTKFKIRDGINLSQEGFWHPEMEEKYKDFKGRS